MEQNQDAAPGVDTQLTDSHGDHNMKDAYSPHTGEFIDTDNPADWMGRAGVECPAHDRKTQAAFWRGGPDWVIEDVVHVDEIPQSCTPAQGGIALIRMGFMAAVEAVISNMRQDPTTYAEVLWAWDRATVWERPSPSLNTLATAAGITQSQMDDLFTLASTIVA